MKVLIFGATGMVGDGVLRECLLAADVERVQTVGRSATNKQDAKLTEIVHADLFHYDSVEADLTGFGACFFCLGISSAGMSEADYTHMTYNLTLAAATTLARLNPEMVFIYVSGAGTDSSEQGRTMWARVKGRTENALLHLPFRAAYMFRPGIIEPLHGAQSKTRSYRVLYAISKPLFPVVRLLAPDSVLTTELVGRAMLNAVRNGAESAVLESKDILALAKA